MSTPREEQDFEAFLERNSALSRRYHTEASEQPSAEVDAAILAAARREVGSRPQPVKRWRPSWQVPVSLAAVVVLGVGIALRVAQHEEKVAQPRLAEQRTAAPSSVEPDRGVAQEPAPAAVTEGATDKIAAAEAEKRAQDAAPQPAAAAARPGAAVSSPIKRKGEAAGPPSERGRLADRAAERDEAQPHAPLELAQRESEAIAGGKIRAAEPARAEAASTGAADASAPAAGAPEVLPRSRADAALEAKRSAASEAAGAGPMLSAPAPPAAAAKSVEPADSAPPSAAPAAPPKEAGSADEPGLDQWVKRIVELRKAGRDKDADAEIRKFKARYPDYRLPAGAYRAE